MKEDFLHYIWKFKKFNLSRAITVKGEPVTLIDPGMANLIPVRISLMPNLK
jgi:hypothetical protein